MSKLHFIILLLCIYFINCQDNKLTGTEFSSPETATEKWIAYELSSPAKITKIGITHTSTNAKDYLLGVFEGANDKTFFDAFPIYLIKEQLEPNQQHLIEITCTQAFKYVRYVSPEVKNPGPGITQFEVYGTAQASGETGQEKYYQPTNIPLLIINSENSELPQGRDRETRKKINVIIISDGKINVKQTGTIKLRGNSSLDSQKKPYLIKFDEKTTFLDMPCKDKKWVLISNMYDKSLLRNLLGYKMSEIFQLKFTPSCRFVDVIINGNFRGNYLICDKIEVQSDRVAITKMDETCNQEPEVSGGYLIQGTGSETKTAPQLFGTAKGIYLSLEYPDIEDATAQQKVYVKSLVDTVEARIYENNLENIDLETFARYFLIEDFSGNQDEIYNSFFFWKDRGDNKIYFGPVWDFDLAFDNGMLLYPVNEKKNFSFKYGLSNGTTNKLVAQILSNEVALKKVKDVWAEMTATTFTKAKIIDFLNQQIEYINESQKLNFMKWDVLNSRQFMEANLRGSFEAEVNYLKEFVETRFDVFGGIVNSATTESVLEQVQGGFGFGFGGGNMPWGGGNGGNMPWGGNGGNMPWGGNGNNGDNPWGGGNGGNNPWGGNGNNQWPNNGGNNQMPNNGGNNQMPNNGGNNQWPNNGGNNQWQNNGNN